MLQDAYQALKPDLQVVEARVPRERATTESTVRAADVQRLQREVLPADTNGRVTSPDSPPLPRNVLQLQNRTRSEDERVVGRSHQGRLVRGVPRC